LKVPSSRIHVLLHPEPYALHTCIVTTMRRGGGGREKDYSESMRERWGAGVETQKNVRERLGDGVEYHLMSPTPRR